MKLLHIDSAITGGDSVTRKLSANIVARLRASDPNAVLRYRDLAADPIPHLQLGDLAGAGGITTVLDEFLDSDVVVIGAPMYNFTLPSQLKAWVDRILVAGKTFSYGATGPLGLAGGKRVIIGLSRGGLFGSNSPMAHAEHLETYLDWVFGFIGIKPEFVIAEGLLAIPEQRAEILENAERSIAALAA